VRVFDLTGLSPSASPDGEDVLVRALDERLGCDLGGYLVVATRTDAWDAIVAVLAALEDDHHDRFHHVMSGCRSLSNSRPEVDGLDELLGDREQVMFDLAFDREQRREKRGYLTPAQARAFLQMSRQPHESNDATAHHDPVTRAYFRAFEGTTTTDASGDSSGRPPASDQLPAAKQDLADAVSGVVEVLMEAGVLTPQPRALLDGPQENAPRLARIRAHLQFVRDCDAAAYSMRSQELAYLANTILAGCSIQARPFTTQEASDAAVAVCNLGLENWPPNRLAADARHASSVVQAGAVLSDDFLVGHNLVSVFQIGWSVLHRDVCMDAAERLIRVLIGLSCRDLETQAGLDELRIVMARHWQAGVPWRARDALDVIAILDMPAWATLLGLIDECPVMHAALRASRVSRTRAVSASAFEFISENAQIASIREFMQSLPETLRA
jgi:hypothetical protein